MSRDVYISYFVEDNAEFSVPRYFRFAFDTPRSVEGVTKLLMVFLKDLFTSKGSDIYDTRAGTDLPTLIHGNVSDIEEAEDIVTIAIDQAAQNVARYQSGAQIPEDERVGILELVELVEVSEGLEATLRVQNSVGESLIVSLPVT